MDYIKRELKNLYFLYESVILFFFNSNYRGYTKYKALLQSLKIETDEFVILSSTGIGDMYLKLILINGLKETLKTQKISVGYSKEKHKHIINFFSQHIYRTYYLQADDMKILSKYSTAPTLGSASHPFFVINNFESIGYKDFTFIDLIKMQLNIPLYFKEYLLPVQNVEIVNRINIYLDSLGLEKNKTVLISPKAVSFKNIASDFWTELITVLLSLNYKILVSDDERYVENNHVIYLNFPLEESIAICDYCGFFIGYRSGLCDLISTSTAKKIIIYPENPTGITDYLEGFSLSKMGLDVENNTYELIYKDSDTESVIKKIITQLTNK